jgi:hypothetical protein
LSVLAAPFDARWRGFTCRRGVPQGPDCGTGEIR